MTVETTINNFMNQLKALSIYYRAEASDLIRAADNRLSALRTPLLADLEYEAERDSPEFNRVPRPPTLSGLKELVIPEIGDLQELLEVKGRFTGQIPTLKIPNSRQPTTSYAPDFTGQVPSLPSADIHPLAPSLSSPILPEQTPPTVVSVDPITGNPPNVPKPFFTEFTGNLFDEYENGLQWLGLAEWSVWLNSLRDQLLPIEERLVERLRKVLTGVEPGLPDTWETQTFQQGQQIAYNERYTGLEALDVQPSSVTGLPAGARTYSRLRIELQALQAVMDAAAKTTNERHQREVQHLQWALELCLKMADAAIQIKAQEAFWRMKGVMLALDGAEATLDVALKVLAFKEKELAFITRYNETQVRRTEDLIKIEKTKLEALQIEVANNKLKTTYNEHQATLYQTVGQWIETTIRLYTTQLDYLKVDVGWRDLAQQGFAAEVAAYQAKIKGAEADLATQQAQIKGDLVRAEAEMAKVRLYEAQWTELSAETQAKIAKAKAQAQQNAAQLAEYNATLSAQLNYLQITDRSVDTAISAIMKSFDAEVAEQKMQLADQEIKDQAVLNNAMNELQLDYLELDKALKIHQNTLAQLAIQSAVMDSGAGTLGGIAASAFGGLNSVAAQDILEEA